MQQDTNRTRNNFHHTPNKGALVDFFDGSHNDRLAHKNTVYHLGDIARRLVVRNHGRTDPTAHILRVRHGRADQSAVLSPEHGLWEHRPVPERLARPALYNTREHDYNADTLFQDHAVEIACRAFERGLRRNVGVRDHVPVGVEAAHKARVDV